MQRFLIRKLKGTREFSKYLKGKGELTNDCCISRMHTCNVEVPHDRVETQTSVAGEFEMQYEDHKEITRLNSEILVDEGTLQLSFL